MLRASIQIVIACALLGCRSTDRLSFIDDDQLSEPPTIVYVRADGDRFAVSFLQDAAPIAWVHGLKADVIGGNVYLSAVPSSIPSSQTEFWIDFSSVQFPRDWKDRLYWVAADRISMNMTTGESRRTAIYRRKLEIREGKKAAEPGATDNPDAAQ